MESKFVDMQNQDKIDEYRKSHPIQNYLYNKAEIAFTLLCEAYHNLKAQPKVLTSQDVLRKRMLLRSFFTDIGNLLDIFFKQRVFMWGKEFGQKGLPLEEFKKKEFLMSLQKVDPLEWLGWLDEQNTSIGLPSNRDDNIRCRIKVEFEKKSKKVF